VEAYAWDLESNTRRKVVFQVEHAMMANKKKKILTDPRDIYEYVANQAQRRVRTCLENIIPRDIVDAACEECERTLKAEITDVQEATAKMLAAFTQFGVSQGMIEGRIQRRIDAITPAQIIGMKKIYASLRDGMSEPGDWFDVPPEEEKPVQETAIEKAKAAMREKAGAAATAPPAEAPKVQPKPAAPPSSPPRPPKAPPAAKKSSETRQEQDPEKAARDAREVASSGAGAVAGAPAETPATPPREREPGDDDEPMADSTPVEPAKRADPAAPAEDQEFVDQAAQWMIDLDSVNTVRGLKDALAAIPPTWPASLQVQVSDAIKKKIDQIHGSRGEASNAS
jgi:hypothetical protein